MRRIGILAGVVGMTALALSWSPAGPAEAQGVKPSFDCARASTEVEQAICKDPNLAAADRKVAAAYAAARARFTGVARTQLLRDQQWFNESRDYALVVYNEEVLLGFLQDRAESLDAMIPAPGAGMIGKWSSLIGNITVKPAGAGRVSVEILTASPEASKWICEVEGTSTIARDGSATITSDLMDGYKIKLIRQGQTLRADFIFPPGIESAIGVPFCGYNGTVEGNYLPTRG